ncbi:MAG: AAA family ATPase [Anaerolineales bacterium]
MGTTYPPTIFVLGTARNIGKTVTCMGIISNLLSDEHGYAREQIGYMKPVGQQTRRVTDSMGESIEVDKDAVLITSLMGIQHAGYEYISPVVLRGGVTASYIDEAVNGDPLVARKTFLKRICTSYKRVCADKRVVLVEGTGQPGVGSVAGISNADVINTLRDMGVPLFVIMVTQGGIGSTLDQVFPYLMAMEHLGAHVDGLIVNGIYISKMDKIVHYLESYYDRVFVPLYGEHLEGQSPPPILGFIPSVSALRAPTMRLIAEEFSERPDSGMEIVAPENFDTVAVQLIGALRVISLDFGYEPLLKPRDAAVIGVNANDAILATFLHHERLVHQDGEGLSGVILSCKYVGGLADRIRELIVKKDLPTLTLDYDSAEIVQRIENMTVKIQPYDVHKRELIAEVYEKHLTLWPELQLV